MHGPVAIVHDWLTSMRGGERVVEVLCDMFPEADLFTLTWDPKRLSPALAKRRATTSPIHHFAHAPLVGGRFRGLLPLFPRAMESFRLHRYATVISSSHCVALGARVSPTALHVGYCHSTLRYVRESQSIYESRVPGGKVGRAAFRATASYLRQWDTAAAARPDLLIANSRFTRERIRNYYDRDALVIEPPIDTVRFERVALKTRAQKGAPFLMLSALVPNKRVDLAVRAFHGRTERLIVVGEGPERARIERLLGPNVTLLPRVDEAELERLYGNCRALVHTAVEDFGMVMAEALAAGKPVLACAEGGALDIVRDGETGLLIESPTVESVRATLDRFNAMGPHAFDPKVLQRFAKRLDRANFERRFHEAVDDARKKRAPARQYGVGLDGMAESRLEAPVAANAGIGPKVKRALDVVIASAGLVASGPVIAALSAWIALDSKGSPFFWQSRTGLDQRPFSLVKLRTFNNGTVTRVGRIVRPTGLDELPQLWNVLKGDMSLIGPRPEIPEKVARYQREFVGYEKRHAVRPGITGWAQVNGLRGDVSIAERLRFDMQYLRDWSLALDAKILFRTFSSVAADTLREWRAPAE